MWGSSITSSTLGLRTTGLGSVKGAAGVASACAACAACVACAALACTALASCAVFTTLEKELRKPPPAGALVEEVDEKGEEEAGPGAWGWGETDGCGRLSVAGEAGELVELVGRPGVGDGVGDGDGDGDGRWRSIM